MKYVNVWNDIEPAVRWKGDEGLIDYLIEESQKEPIALMCAEEASLHSATPFFTKEKFSFDAMLIYFLLTFPRFSNNLFSKII